MNTIVANEGGVFPEERTELNPGDCLAGRYRILGVLGTGGMSTVYKANDLRLKRDVAIKVVLPELRRNWKTLQRFMREAQSMAALDSARVVPVYDVGQDGERYFMVMKLVAAPSLADILEKGPLGEERALSIIAGVLEGLRELHQRGIVHRDVKPSNIVIEEGDHPMLLDFGIVLELGEPSLTSEGMLVGTPHYMAPEQIFSPTNVDGRADLYAVGVLMFEVLTGKLPYQGNTPQALMKNHLTVEVPDPKTLAPHLTPRTTQVVQRALIKDPDLRYQNADEMLSDMRDELEAADVEPIEIDAPPGMPKDQFIYAILGATLLAIAAFVVATPFFEKKPQPIFAEVKARPLPPPVVMPVVPPAPPPPAPPEAATVEPPPPPRAKRRVKTVKPAPKVEVLLASVPSRDPDVSQAQALLRKGDTRAAIKLLDGAIAKNPKSPEPYPTLGDAYALTGNKNGAIAAYRRYLVLSPRGAGVKQVEAALDRLGGR